MAGGALKVKMMALPSRRRSLRVPVPSIWPETIWPPKRPSAANARSRLTRSPLFRVPRLEWRRVSTETSKAISRSATLVTVRQTPLTAILSPSLHPSRISMAPIRNSPEPPVRLELITEPISSMMPVNIDRLVF